jgi:GTP pyrophosphokinase
MEERTTSLLTAPQFARGSDLLEGAYGFALVAHHGRDRAGGTDIRHPEAVARLLADNGFDEEIVAAALLHDVVEDTETELDEIERSFGSAVADLVGEMTEDPRIEPYSSRKAEHRARVARDGRAAAIYAADKIASIRSARAEHEPIHPERLDHFLRTLETLRHAQPDLPFLADLQHELNTIRAAR